MEDQILLLVEEYTHFVDRRDFYRSLGKSTVDAEVSCELAENAAKVEREVERLQKELMRYGATFDSNGGIRWPSDEVVNK